MSQFELFLNRLEARLRLLIEGDAAHDGFPSKLHRQLERELLRAMQAGVRKLEQGIAPASPVKIAPDQYILALPAVDAQILLNHPTELARLIRKMKNSASSEGIMFSGSPLLRVVVDPQSIAINIQADFSQPGMEASSTYQLDGLLDTPGLMPTEKLPKAFLIVNGLSTYSITTPVVNIGRDPSNQLQLDDPRISRQHAQLRFIQGRFVIFDLDSRCGTFVNSMPVSSHALKPGDVIQLAFLPLVFGQEDGQLASYTQELPAEPPPPEML